ncbi:MAG TPA: hypothetical protein VNJ01_09645 [Bacteriovoracaceae bacterium]|nr:hypothetical protein [Bacteriovoracaceae bacterium]
MKYLSFLFLLGSVAFAKDVREFNHELITDVQREYKMDSERYKSSSPGRAPASLGVQAIQDESKLDKNFRQIGPRKW